MGRTIARAGVAVALGFLLLPLLGLLFRAPWSGLASLLTGEELRTTLGLSLVVSLSATALAALLGLPLAWALVRLRRGALRRVVLAVALLPMVLPPVVGGVALLLAFGRRGLLGAPLADWFGIRLAFTTAGAVLAATFVALPFFVLSAQAGLRAVETRFVEVGRVMGLSGPMSFLRVTVPMARPALAAGAVVAWARAVGEFGATITFAGSFPGRTQTLPLAVYVALDSRPDAAVALSLVLLVVSLAVLLALRDRWLGTGTGATPAVG